MLAHLIRKLRFVRGETFFMIICMLHTVLQQDVYAEAGMHVFSSSVT